MKQVAYTAFRLALFNLAIQATLGLLLRYLAWQPFVGIIYKNLLFGHGHFGMAGWVFTALFSLLLLNFGPQQINARPYKIALLATQAGAYGMLFTFPFQGYGAASIAFSQLYVLAGYALAFLLYRDTKADRRLSAKCLRTALLLLVGSSLGPYVLGVLMARKVTDPAIINNVAYFYLHFQYNGWFVFALMALGVRLLEQYAGDEILAQAHSFYRLQTIAVVPAYLLSILWAQPPAWVYGVAFTAAVLQLVSLYPLFGIVKRTWRLLQAQSTVLKMLIAVAVLSLIAKILLQFASAFPAIAALAYMHRPFIIAYLHLVLVGAISFSLLAFFIYHQQLQQAKLIHTALAVFGGGYLLSQLLLVGEGCSNWLLSGSLPHLYLLLVLAGLPMAAGAWLLAGAVPAAGCAE